MWDHPQHSHPHHHPRSRDRPFCACPPAVPPRNARVQGGHGFHGCKVLSPSVGGGVHFPTIAKTSQQDAQHGRTKARNFVRCSPTVSDWENGSTDRKGGGAGGRDREVRWENGQKGGRRGQRERNQLTVEREEKWTATTVTRRQRKQKRERMERRDHAV